MRIFFIWDIPLLPPNQTCSIYLFSDSEQLLEEPRSSQREEMALCLETEELTSLATSLQAMIENEKVEISRLKNKIRALGGNPVYK